MTTAIAVAGSTRHKRLNVRRRRRAESGPVRFEAVTQSEV